MKDLQKSYNRICSEYIKLFEKKQDLELDFWVSNDIGGVACFGDIYFFTFDDIKLDIDSNQPKGLIISYLEDSMEFREMDQINYKSYCMGLRYKDLK